MTKSQTVHGAFLVFGYKTVEMTKFHQSMVHIQNSASPWCVSTPCGIDKIPPVHGAYLFHLEINLQIGPNLSPWYVCRVYTPVNSLRLSEPYMRQ